MSMNAEAQERDHREDEGELDEGLAARCDARVSGAHGVTVIVDVHGTAVARSMLWS